MYDVKKSPFSIKSSDAVTKFRPSKTMTGKPKKIKKFWEELLLKDAIQSVMFLSPQDSGEYYESLINGDKQPWQEYLLHKTQTLDNGKKQFPDTICSAGLDRYNKKPCVGCYQYDHFTGRPNPWKPSPTCKFNIIHFANYHDVPRLKDGKQVIYNDIPQFNKEKCVGEGCQFCKDGNKPVFGRLMKLTFGQNHTKQLFEIRRGLFWTCAGCNTAIVVNNLSCSNEDCGKVLKEDLKGKKIEDVEGLLQTEIECIHCGTIGLPIEGSDCGYKADRTMKLKKHNCPFSAPARMDIFSAVLDLSKTGEKLESTIKLAAAYSVYEDGNSPYQFDCEDNLDTIVNRAIKANSGELFDLHEEVVDFIMEPAEQALILRVPNPYEGEGKIPGVAPRVPMYVKDREDVIFPGN